MIILKPDAFERKLIGDLIVDLSLHGPIRGAFIKAFNDKDCAIHYRDHVGQAYYGRLCDHMKSGLSMFIVFKAPVNDLRSKSLYLRNKYGTEGPRNLIHASDSVEADERETAYWFPQGYLDYNGLGTG